MPYKLGEIWNEAITYITTFKKVGINTTKPESELDVQGNITEDGQKLKDKYTLKTDDNKKERLIVLENRDNFNNSSPIIWYKFNKDDFTSNTGITENVIFNIIGTPESHQSNYIIGTGSAKINSDLYYEIKLTTDSTTRLTESQHTICFWIYFSDIDNKTIINSIKDSNRNFKIVLDNKKIKFITYEQEKSLTSSQEFRSNQWYHITFSIDSSGSDLDELIIYIDGIEDENKLFDKNIIINKTDYPTVIYLGNINQESFNGYIDDFRIYNDKLSLSTIQKDIIGNLSRISPGNISSLGNYGLDIVNFSNLVTVGNTNNKVDLKIYGDLSVNNISDSITINENLTVNNDIIENQKRLIDKYALISSTDKNTDIIISKMIDREDVDTLYSNMPTCFSETLILAYDFDYDSEDFNNSNIFFNNYSRNGNFNRYSITPYQTKSPIEYYGSKYVKGTSALQCGSNVDGVDYYYFDTNTDTDTEYNDLTSTFSKDNCYTITFWIRFNEIDRKQHVFSFGKQLTNANAIKLYLNNKKLYFSINDIDINTNIDELKKDEWYHITLILKNANTISIPKDQFSGTDDFNNSNILIDFFKKIKYNVNFSDQNDFIFTPVDDNGESEEYLIGVYMYINGIEVYNTNHLTQNSPTPIYFGNRNNSTNYFGVKNATDTSEYLNGYIDDFKMYEQIVPIYYINKYIVGTTLVIKPGQLSAIGNYGIDIKNFENLVTVGNEENVVDLNIYGTLMITNDNLSGSITTISNNILQTSNLTITDTLNTNCNISQNINVVNEITGNGFLLGIDNYIETIKIDTLTNSNLTTSNIITDIINSTLINVNNTTITDTLNTNCNISQNINVINEIHGNGFFLGIDNYIETIKIDTLTNSNLTADIINVNSRVVIGDHNSNSRYDLNSYQFNDENLDIPFSDYPNFATVSISEDINIYDKSFIFYGNCNSENADIKFKDSYIRDSSCNIQDEMAKAHNEDRSRTRIQSDVGNIKLRNGYIELEQYDIRSNIQNSLLTINEDSININDTTVLNSSLRLGNDIDYSLLTSSNFMFNGGYGFIDNKTLKIHTIDLIETLIVPNLENTDLIGNGKINITNEIITTSNIRANNLNISNLVDTSNINCSNINCENTTTVNTLVVRNNIILGDSTDNPSSGTGNSIDGGFGSLNITNITTDDITCRSNITTDSLKCSIFEFLNNNGEITSTKVTYSNIIVDRINTTNTTGYAIDTFNNNEYGIVRCKLSSNSIIDVDNITTGSIYVDTITSAVTFTFKDANITINDTGISFRNNSFGGYDLILDKNALKVYHAENNPLNKNIINYEFDTTKRDFITTIECDELTVTKLTVTNFDVGENAFSFPNIISYDKNDNLNIPNIFIGHDKIADDIDFDDNKDVLYVDTPNDSRLRCGNILVEKNINIGNTDNNLRISTGTIGGLEENTNSFTNDLYTTFTNKQLDNILVLSLAYGTVGINVTPPTSIDEDKIKLFVDGGIQTSGDIIAFQSISDKRFKENIEPLNDDIDIVNKLNPVKFKWKYNLFNKTNAGKDDIGFIAQEIEELIPYAVSNAKIEFTETDYKYIKYERLIPYLVNNIKYLNNKIVELENKLK